MRSYSVTVTPYSNPKRPNLRAQLRVRHASGKVERSYFESIEKAKTEAQVRKLGIERDGISAINLDPRSRLLCIDALERLKPFEVTISEAVDFFIEHHQLSCTVSEACNIYQTCRKSKGWSDRHRNNLSRIVKRFCEEYGSKQANALTCEDVEKWLDSLDVSGVAMNSYRRLLGAVFAYCVKKKLIKHNPIAMVELQQEKSAPVGILTPKQMISLIEAAKHQPDVLATIMLGGFAGLRPEEIARLKWWDIDWEGRKISVSAEVSKTAKHRYVKIEEAVIRYITFDGLRAKNSIQNPNFRRRWEAVRKAAGIDPWPHDALRHSFASYHLAHLKNAANTALELGHSDTKMLFANYRARVSEQDAAKWWEIGVTKTETITTGNQ